MVIDASALVAILLAEPDARDLFEKIWAATSRKTIASAVWESCVSVANRSAVPISQSQLLFEELIAALEIEIVPIPPQAGFAAVDAYDRFGKGRHPAALNFGDCLSYAMANVLAEPLLYKGDDFGRTDIVAA